MARHAVSDEKDMARGVAAGVVDQAPTPRPEHRRLEALIGRWMTEGHTVASPDSASVKILASDVYEWMPGGFFVLHTAYGQIGDIGVGGVEIIGFDPASKTYRTHFFDSQGAISTDELTIQNGTWRWQGERTRATGVFTNHGKIQVLHERSDDGVSWVPSMEVVLTKVE